MGHETIQYVTIHHNTILIPFDQLANVGHLVKALFLAQSLDIDVGVAAVTPKALIAQRQRHSATSRPAAIGGLYPFGKRQFYSRTC